jgi:hypothetical protein
MTFKRAAHIHLPSNIECLDLAPIKLAQTGGLNTCCDRTNTHHIENVQYFQIDKIWLTDLSQQSAANTVKNKQIDASAACQVRRKQDGEPVVSMIQQCPPKCEPG